MGGRGQWGTHGGNVKNEEIRGEREGDGRIEEQKREMGIDWGQTWLLIEGTDR